MLRMPDPETLPMVESAAKVTVPVELFCNEVMVFDPLVLVKFRVLSLMTVPMLFVAPLTLIVPC